MSSPQPPDAPPAPPAKQAKPGDIVSYVRKDPSTGVLEELIGVLVRVAKDEVPHLIRPLAHYLHEIDPADVAPASAADAAG